MMRKNVLRYILSIIVILLVAYNSVYFKKLDEVKAAKDAKTFDAAAYAQGFWEKKLMPNLDSAVNFGELMHTFGANTAVAFDEYSHALGIGNLRYFLIRAEGQVKAIDADNVIVTVKESPQTTIKIATEYIFGNAVRDATGLININDFSNTMDFNNVSAEINKIVRAKILPLLKNVKVGDKIDFTGAMELNKEHINLLQIEVIPVAVKIMP
jgi:predicted lipoprotein